MSLTSTGFDRPRLNEIKSDYDQRFMDALGPVNTAPDAVVGQIVAVFAAALDDAYEALQSTYDSMYPSSAEGTSLDGAVSFVGITRLAAAPTTVTAMCYGTESTLIPAGALARSLGNKQYISSADTVISRANAGHVEIEVLTVTNSASYQIIAGGASVTYTSDASATATEIANGLAALFNPAVFVATAASGILTLKPIDLASEYTLTVDTKLSIRLLSTPIFFTALEMGAFALPAGSLTTIDSSVLGWNSINNLAAGNIGRAVETDEALRKRHADSVMVSGAATVPAIRARLLAEVDSIDYVAIYENRTSVTDVTGLPPHSFEAVVSGGADQAVADKLFEVKPAGIETYGNTTEQVLDENGDMQTVGFSRPAIKYGWIRVTVTSLNSEEILDPEYVTSIQIAALAHGNSIGIGRDIITQRFFGPIYESTPGLGGIIIEAAITAAPLDTPAYTASNIIIARAELASFDLARIVVVGI